MVSYEMDNSVAYTDDLSPETLNEIAVRRTPTVGFLDEGRFHYSSEWAALCYERLCEGDCEVFGQGASRFYDPASRGYRIKRHPRKIAPASLAFTTRMIPWIQGMRVKDGECLATRIWDETKALKRASTDIYVTEMGPQAEGFFSEFDEDGSVLRAWLGEDAEGYL